MLAPREAQQPVIGPAALGPPGDSQGAVPRAALIPVPTGDVALPTEADRRRTLLG
jgi:hypothetical protein